MQLAALDPVVQLERGHNLAGALSSLLVLQKSDGCSTLLVNYFFKILRCKGRISYQQGPIGIGIHVFLKSMAFYAFKNKNFVFLNNFSGKNRFQG